MPVSGISRSAMPAPPASIIDSGLIVSPGESVVPKVPSSCARRGADEKTALWFVDEKTKKDKYCTYNIDDLIETLRWNDDYWVYILDHDNLLRYNFP